MATPLDDTVAVQLLFFRLYANGDAVQHRTYPLFSNSRQQLKIRIEFIAANAKGDVVSLSPAQKNAIKLISWNGSTDLSAPWTSSAGSKGYDYDLAFFSQAGVSMAPEELLSTATDDTTERGDSSDPAEEDAEVLIWGTTPLSDEQKIAVSTRHPRAQPAGIDFIERFVSTTDTILKKIGAKIAFGNTTVLTNTWSGAEAANDDGWGDGKGRFNSSLSIQPRKLTPLSSSNYGVREPSDPGRLKETLIRSIEANSRAYESHLDIRLSNGAMLPIKRLTSWQSLSGDLGDGPSSGKLSFTYMGNPNQTTILYTMPSHFGDRGTMRHSIELLDEVLLVRTIRYPREGQIVVGHFLTGHDIWFYHGDYSRADHVISQLLEFEDIYGNLHQIYYKFNRDRLYSYVWIV